MHQQQREQHRVPDHRIAFLENHDQLGWRQIENVDDVKKKMSNDDSETETENPKMTQHVMHDSIR